MFLDPSLKSFKVSLLNIRFYLKYQISHWENYLILHLPTASSLTDTQFHHVIFLYIHRIMVFLLQSGNEMNSTDFVNPTLYFQDGQLSTAISACLWICSIFFSYIILSYIKVKGVLFFKWGRNYFFLPFFCKTLKKTSLFLRRPFIYWLISLMIMNMQTFKLQFLLCGFYK